jgi:hypothetical protein
MQGGGTHIFLEPERYEVSLDSPRVQLAQTPPGELKARRWLAWSL